MNETRLFLAVAIGSGLDAGMISPDDLIEYATMDVLAHHLPIPLKAQLLTAALAADSMGPELVLDTLGVGSFAEHAPMEVLWACVRAVAQRELNIAGAGLVGPTKATLPPPGTSSGRKRKPNRSSRVRAGATSRAMAQNPVALPSIEDDEEFEAVTRVGGIIDESDIAEEVSILRSRSGSEVTQHGGD